VFIVELKTKNGFTWRVALTKSRLLRGHFLYGKANILI
jgi:hypothetical protein